MLVTRSIGALLRDDNGQDIIEYALLTAFIGLAGLGVWPLIAEALGLAYSGFDSGIQGLWQPPEPP